MCILMWQEDGLASHNERDSPVYVRYPFPLPLPHRAVYGIPGNVQKVDIEAKVCP